MPKRWRSLWGVVKILYIEGNTIKLTRGDTAYLSVPITNITLGERYEIAENDILEFTVKKYASDGPSLIYKKIIGRNTFHIYPEDTKDLPFGKYEYDIQLTTAKGDVYTVIDVSAFEVLKEVT